MTGQRWLAVAAAGYGVVHHQGTLLADLGETVDETRWADWIDLATPYAVLLPVAVALLAFGADRVAWLTYVVGAVTYVEGHGIHLSANSIGNVPRAEDDPWPPLVHLWDEGVGHHLWIAGVVIVVLAISRAARNQPAPGLAPYPLAALVGVTFFTNSVEGGAPVLGLLGAALLAAVGWVHRRGFDRLLLATYAPALVLLAGYGIWQGGFPQFTELGWA